jgi:hypothetical protein
MGYILYAFIGKQEDILPMQKAYSHAKSVQLRQGISLIPMTRELYDQINNFTLSDNINGFIYLTTNIENQILKVVGSNSIAYIEAEYFGGNGGQKAIIWKDNQRLLTFPHSQDAINKTLQSLGVTPDKRKDEFDTVGLRRYRNMEEWVEASI